ncbi:hypothetical protein K2Q08_00185 [Patescibacteria group bacterium]|nr:hypothetical protein [Patescibacteria group bacterium]
MNHSRGFTWLSVLIVVVALLVISAGAYFYKYPERLAQIGISFTEAGIPQTQIYADEDLPMVTYMETVGGGYATQTKEVTKRAIGMGVVVDPTGDEKIPANIKSAKKSPTYGVILRMVYIGQEYSDYTIEHPTYPKVLSEYPGGVWYLYCSSLANSVGEQVVVVQRKCDPGESGLITPDGRDVAIQSWASN